MGADGLWWEKDSVLHHGENASVERYGGGEGGN